ncbi:hypothetical protein Psi02_62920 [Planotetraspora silvatica]|uniref:Uncharacterized protein n=1 Tax=Planotetraspora silvatica TaxID=234614 RepID=A0A8J3UR87_9ACTN|nr:hypothetical protein Psi02_62920 [Planotetraspora silvatica]
MFALWTWADGAVGPAPPVGDVQTVPLVVPTPDLGGLKVSDVDCVLIEPDRLVAVPLDSPGRSVDAAAISCRSASRSSARACSQRLPIRG